LTGCGLRNIPQTVRENAHDLSAYVRKNHESKTGAMGAHALLKVLAIFSGVFKHRQKLRTAEHGEPPK
jgi:hypothetical protein